MIVYRFFRRYEPFSRSRRIEAHQPQLRHSALSQPRPESAQCRAIYPGVLLTSPREEHARSRRPPHRGFTAEDCLFTNHLKDMSDIVQTDTQVLDFSRPERQIYKHLEDRAKRHFIQLDAEGRAMSNYTSILAMLMK